MLAIVSPKVSIVNIIHFPFLHKVITISATSNPAVIQPMRSLLVLFIVIFNQRVCSCSQNESSDHNCQHHFLFPFANYCVMFCLRQAYLTQSLVIVLIRFAAAIDKQKIAIIFLYPFCYFLIIERRSNPPITIKHPVIKNSFYLLMLL